MKKVYNEFDVCNCKGVSLGDCRIEKEDGALVSSKTEIQEVQKLLQENLYLILILQFTPTPLRYSTIITVVSRKRANGRCTLHCAQTGGWADIQAINIVYY